MRRLPFTNNRLSSAGFGQVKDDGLVWSFVPELGDPDSLTTSITLNGNTATPECYYVGDGAGGFTAKAGSALSLIGSGAAPVNTLNHPFASDIVTKFNLGKIYTSNSGADLTTERFIVGHLIWSHGGSSAQYVGGNFDGSDGIAVYTVTTTAYCRIGARTINCGACRPDAINELFFVFDRTTETQYSLINGTQTLTSVSGAWPASLTTSGDTAIGSRIDGSFDLDGSISLFSLWASDSDLGTATDWAALAKERHALASGFTSSVGVPDTMTRASEKCLEIVGTDSATRFVQAGNNWLGGERKTRDGSTYEAYRAEVAGASTVEYPTDCSQVSDWTLTRLTSASKSSTVLGPVNGLYANELISNTDNNTHYVEYDGAGGTTDHVMSWIVAPGDKTWCEITSTAGGTVSAFFDLSGSGAVGTTSGCSNCLIFPLGTIGGVPWYRVSAYYALGAAGVHDHRLLPAVSDTVNSFAGDGSTVDLYFAHAQHEILTTGHPTSPMINNNAGSSRSAEDNSFAVTGIPGDKNRIRTDTAMDTTAAIGVIRYIMNLSDGTGNERTSLFILTTNATLSNKIVAGGGTQDELLVANFGTSDGGLVSNSNIGGDLSLTTDVGSDTGTAATSPTDPTEINVAVSSSSALQGTILDIKSIKVYTK